MKTMKHMAIVAIASAGLFSSAIVSAGASDDNMSGQSAQSTASQDDGHDHEHGNMSGMASSPSDESTASQEDDGHDQAQDNSSSDESTASQDDGHDHEHGNMSGMASSPSD